MTSTKILLAGIAAGALLAGAASTASAITLSGTTVAGVAVGGAPTTPYTIATEAKFPSGGLSGTVVSAAALQTGTLTSGQYYVTFTLSGPAAFSTAGLNGNSIQYTGTGGGAGGAFTTNAVLQNSSPTQVVFLVTIGTGDTVTGFKFPDTVAVTSASAVSLTSNVVFAANSLQVDGAPGSGLIIGFTPGFSAGSDGHAATVETALLSSGYTNFKVPPATSATVADIGGVESTTTTVFNPAVAATVANGIIYRDLSTDAVSPNDITGTTVTATGTLGATETMTIMGQARGNTTGYPVFTFGAGALDSDVTLTQTGASPLAASSYSAMIQSSLNPTFYNAPAPATVQLGSVLFDGTNFLVPWVPVSGASVINIRLSNTSTTASGPLIVTALTPVTTSNGVTSSVPGALKSCTIPGKTVVPALSDVNIASADLATCFPGVTRSDILVTIQSLPTYITAKSRIISDGVATENVLGAYTTGAISALTFPNNAPPPATAP